VVKVRRWMQRNPALATALVGLFLVLAVGLGITVHFLQRTQTLLEREAAARREANRLLASYEWLSLKDLMVRSRELWPATPERIPDLEAWIREAHGLVERLDGLSTAQVGPPDEKHKWHGELVAALERLVAPVPHGDTLCAVEARLDFARTLRRRSIEEAQAQWDGATEAIARSRRYGGRTLVPQLGLVPLGPDPVSGLWEFAHLQTGEPAVRDPKTGRLRITEATGVVFVLLPGGSFMNGAPEAAADLQPSSKPRDNEHPAHEVTLAFFFLSKYEMTQGQWLRLTGDNPARWQPKAKKRPDKEQAGNAPATRIPPLLRPIEDVSWQECELWMHRLGLLLPTEAQWEYACRRGGTTTAWSTGATRATLRGAANLADQAARRWGATYPAIRDWPGLDDGHGPPAPVGGYRANPFGLHDVHGNVWEWCRDWLRKYQVTAKLAPGDGLRPAYRKRERVLRGGGFESTASEARCTYRTGTAPNVGSPYCGLRPARSVDQ